jgi:hypothetical protein
MIWPLAALPVVIFLWKVIVWDKVLGWVSTDPLTGDVGTWAGIASASQPNMGFGLWCTDTDRIPIHGEARHDRGIA